MQVFSIDGSTGLTLSDITIDDSAGASLGHNTDGFDIGSSTSITISGANVQNQDDCLAINSGTDIVFTGGTCSGGHGLSIGSVGGRTDNTVETVTIESSTVTDSANGVRIKTVSGATGSVTGVTYKDITISGITSYGIVIEQGRYQRSRPRCSVLTETIDYENGSPTGIPTTGVPITDLTLDSITGTVESSAVNIYILCGSGSCSSWTWTDVSITGGETSTACENIPTGATC